MATAVTVASGLGTTVSAFCVWKIWEGSSACQGHVEGRGKEAELLCPGGGESQFDFYSCKESGEVRKPASGPSRGYPGPRALRGASGVHGPGLSEHLCHFQKSCT